MSTELPPLQKATENDLRRWYEVKAELDKLKFRESQLRRFVADGFFANPVEGTNTFTLSDGYQLKLVHSINRKVDDAVLVTQRENLIALGIPVDKLIKWSPELSKSEYNKLTADQKAAFDVVLVASPGSPQMSIVAPKAKKGPPPGQKLEGDQ